MEWASRIPAGGDVMVEVRRVFEMSDFPEDVRAAAELSHVSPGQTTAA